MFALSIKFCTFHCPYLLKPGTSRNDPKKCETTQNFKIGEIWNFLLAFVLQTLSPNAQIWIFSINKYQLSNRSTIFCLYFISKVLISNLALFFENFEPKFGHFGSKGITFLILAKFLMNAISIVPISNLTLVFENFEPKSPNMGVLGRKVSPS